MQAGCASRVACRLRRSPIPVTPIATTSESAVRLTSKLTGIGMMNASMAMKCIDQMPPPMAIAAMASQPPRAQPWDARTRPPRSSAVYEAKHATRIDSATR